MHQTVYKIWPTFTLIPTNRFNIHETSQKGEKQTHSHRGKITNEHKRKINWKYMLNLINKFSFFLAIEPSDMIFIPVFLLLEEHIFIFNVGKQNEEN